jgi:hypothetical protein
MRHTLEKDVHLIEIESVITNDIGTLEEVDTKMKIGACSSIIMFKRGH